MFSSVDDALFPAPLPPGPLGDVLEHGLPPVTEAWRLDAADLERAAQLVHHQGRQCLPFDVLGDEEERFPRLRHLFQDR